MVSDWLIPWWSDLFIRQPVISTSTVAARWVDTRSIPCHIDLNQTAIFLSSNQEGNMVVHICKPMKHSSWLIIEDGDEPKVYRFITSDHMSLGGLSGLVRQQFKLDLYTLNAYACGLRGKNSPQALDLAKILVIYATRRQLLYIRLSCRELTKST